MTRAQNLSDMLRSAFEVSAAQQWFTGSLTYLIDILYCLLGLQNKVHLDTETLKPGLCDDSTNKTQIMCITFWTSFLVFLYDGMQVLN